MSKLSTIQKPVQTEIEDFNARFSDNLKTKVPLLNIITTYIVRRKGKQIRPLLVFLSANLISKSNDSTHTAASLIELLHTATLIHDDVVDESLERRGFFSINALWKSKIAVLLGDYLLAKGLLLAVEKEFKILEIVSDAVREMSEGEILQLQKSRKLNITEEEYFDIIRKKTATLISSCTASGAQSVTVDREIISKMKEFGNLIGIAFQIKDDLFDYERTSITGKPKGNDIQEKKLTLPLIAALMRSEKNERREIIRLINKNSSKRNTYNKVFEFVHKQNGVKYANDKMNEYKNSAIAILESFPENVYRKSLIELVNYIVERKN